MKKLVSKLVTICMLLTMVCTIVPTTSYAATATPVVTSKQISIKKNKGVINKGSKATFTVKYNGKKIKATKCQWKTSNKKVATISKKGTLTAKTEGSTTISCTYKNKTRKIKITVKATKFYGKSEITLDKNKKINVTVLYGKTKVSNNKCYWASSDKKVATVTNGKITTINTGYAYIYATYAKSTAKLKVIVTSNNKPSVTPTPAEPNEPSEPATPVHTHEWVTETKTIVDYPAYTTTKQIETWMCSCGLYLGDCDGPKVVDYEQHISEMNRKYLKEHNYDPTGINPWLIMEHGTYTSAREEPVYVPAQTHQETHTYCKTCGVTKY